MELALGGADGFPVPGDEASRLEHHATARVLGDGEPKPGAHDKLVLFLHPKDFDGTLIELEQV